MAMTDVERKQVYDYLASAGLVDPSVFELTAEDQADGLTSLEEKLALEIPMDEQSDYVIFETEKQNIILFLSGEGVAHYVKDQLDSMEDPDTVVNLLGEFTHDFKDLLEYWGVNFVEEGDTPMATAPKTEYVKTRWSSLKRQAAGTGLGAYRRGKVLTEVGAVQPGQLLGHESIIFNAINLVKVTQVFQDKFFGVFVSPENPNEKSKASDEEFVVYPTDLEKGEYYIALEPAPADVGAQSGDASGEGTKPVAPAPAEDQEPTKPEGTEEAAEESAAPEAEAVPAGKGASKTADYDNLKVGDQVGVYATEDEELVIQGPIEDINSEYPTETGVIPAYKVAGEWWSEEDYNIRPTNTSEAKTAGRYTNGFYQEYTDGFEGAVAVEGLLHKYDLGIEDVDEPLASELLAVARKAFMADEDWAVISQAEDPIRKLVSESSLKLAGKSMDELNKLWADLSNVTTDSNGAIDVQFLDFPAGTDREEIWAWFEEQNPEFSVHDAMYKKSIKSPVRQQLDYGKSKLDQLAAKVKLAGQDEPASSKEAPDASPTTYGEPTHETPLGHFMDDRVKTTDADRVIDEVLTYIEAEHSPALKVEYEDGTYVVMTKDMKPLAEIWSENDQVQVTALVGDKGQSVAEKASDIVDLVLELKEHKDAPQADTSVEDFEVEPEVEEPQAEELFGSRISAINTLLANTETVASAVGGEGDDGSAYDLIDGGGRNFTGVDEATASVVVDEYLNGKATSFASLEDFGGFVSDMYDIPARQVVAGLAEAWDAEDRRAIVAFIKIHATTDMLK